MPHITEEIYSHLPLPNKVKYIMDGDWPTLACTDTSAAETRVERWFAVTRALRALRAALDLEPAKAIAEAYVEGDLAGGESVVASQAWVTTLNLGRPEGKFVSASAEGIDLHLPIGDEVDIPKLVDKLRRDEEKLASEVEKLSERLDNPMFVERAKPEVVERERENLAELIGRLETTRERRSLLE